MPPPRRASASPDAAPWAQARTPEAAFVSLWASGPDPSVDGLLRIEALRRAADGRLERFEQLCNPFAGREEAGAGARLPPEFGLDPRALQEAPAGKQAWSLLQEFLGERALLVGDADAFRAWSAHFEGRRTSARCLLGVEEFCAMWLPGRNAPTRAQRLGKRGAPGAPGAPVAIEAGDVAAAFAELVARVHEFEPQALRLAAAASMCALLALRESDPAAAASFELGLALLERPRHFFDGSVQGANAAPLPHDGAFSAALSPEDLADPAEAARDAIESLEPACSRDEHEREETVPITTEDDKPFDERDLALVDDVFQVQLPAIFSEAGETLRYRAGQHEVAREVARTLGANELLLVHAPTGTGKTLAYLVPALIWAARHGVRVGVTTYTRALQEQAMERELPRALRAIDRATSLGPQRLPCTPRVALLKGRANYLCWRALKLHVPAAEDGHESWLAWLALALFGLRDEALDLDRLALRPAWGGGTREREGREFESLLRQVRAQVGCCSQREDRRSCGAELARQRAERAHVVIANHAFALVKQAFFKHVVFDECEHLHEQAHAAWSHSIPLEEVRSLFGRLHQEDRATSRAPLARLERAVMPGTLAAEALSAAIASWREARDALEILAEEIQVFVTWRAARENARDPKDRHSLLNEYVLLEDAAHLLNARSELGLSTQELSTALAQLVEHLDSLAMRGVPRLRRQLELLRTELEDLYAKLDAWLPLRDGKPEFNEHTFYDVEVDPRGRSVLAARVLLPNEYLGRHYFPELKNAVLLSATTWLRNGFESAQAYLGLDRAAAPAADETRTASVVRCMRAPDPFDYRRVLVAVPSDAPAYSSREAWSAYVRRFLTHLGERTRGRMLVLFTNQEELRRFGEELSGFFSARRIPFWYQGMRGIAKEELAGLFRGRTDSILMGVDTFWYGADFPGETLEYLVIVKLPYGVPDRYHHAQCAALGAGEQRRRIYLPRALAKFRQGFGRLMRRETDRGCVFILDVRVLAPQHRIFLKELPLAGALGPDGTWSSEGARMVRANTDECMHAALAHMDLLDDVKRRGLEIGFADAAPILPIERAASPAPESPPLRRIEPAPEAQEAIDPNELPF